MFYRLKRRDFLKNSTHKFIGLLEVSFFALEELSSKILKKYQRAELSGIRGCEVAFCLGSLLKTVRKFEIDQKRSNALFVNDFLRNLLCASSGDEYIEKDYFGKSAVSEISSCKREVPKVLKENANNPDVAHNLTENLVSYAQQNLPNGIYNSMTAEILRLCAKNNKTQQSIFIKLSNEVAQHNSSTTSNDSEFQQLAKFLSLALIEAVKTTNMIEAGSTITARGNSSLCVVAGSIFNFAFGNRSKNKNIVVIPVNTGFDVHVSRKYEGKTKQVVSIETLHGMWLDEMMRRSASKEFCDNTYTKVSEDSLKRRIEEDLRARGYEKGSNEEYPLGSIAVIEEGNTIFYLLAASKFDENNNAHATKEDIEKLLISLVNFYDCNGQGLDMYLPLIGTGMSRTGLCNQESFNKICKAFSPDANLYIGKVTIVVMPNVYEELELER